MFGYPFPVMSSFCLMQAPRTTIRLLVVVLLLLPMTVVTATTSFNTYKFTFDGTVEDIVKNFIFTGNSTAYQGVVQIPPLAIDKSYLANQSGKVFLTKPFVAASNSIADGSRRVASFSTRFKFLFRRARRNLKGGEGLAFVVVSNIDHVSPPGSHGGYLGLVNASTDGHTANGFVAVEFDNVKQDYDLDDNHVGLNVNGVRSICANSLHPFGIQLNEARKISYVVHIDYNGTSRALSVSMSADDGRKPTIVLQSPMDLSKILLGNRAYFGFSASTGVQSQSHMISDWNLTVE